MMMKRFSVAGAFLVILAGVYAGMMSTNVGILPDPPASQAGHDGDCAWNPKLPSSGHSHIHEPTVVYLMLEKISFPHGGHVIEAASNGGALRNLPHTHPRSRIRRSASGWPGGPGLLVWSAPAGPKDGQRGALLTGQLTAAHRSLPLGTKVKVTNLRTKQHVVVKINDRGPYGGGKGRIIDLSEAAAKRVGLLARGTERVQVVVVENAS